MTFLLKNIYLRVHYFPGTELFRGKVKLKSALHFSAQQERPNFSFVCPQNAKAENYFD